MAQLDADTNGDSFQDTGVYLYDAGAIRTVVRTGTVIPGLGTVVHVNNPFFVGGAYPWPLVHLNERGQVRSAPAALGRGTCGSSEGTAWGLGA